VVGRDTAAWRSSHGSSAGSPQCNASCLAKVESGRLPASTRSTILKSAVLKSLRSSGLNLSHALFEGGVRPLHADPAGTLIPPKNRWPEIGLALMATSGGNGETSRQGQKLGPRRLAEMPGRTFWKSRGARMDGNLRLTSRAVPRQLHVGAQRKIEPNCPKCRRCICHCTRRYLINRRLWSGKTFGSLWSVELEGNSEQPVPASKAL
jgi:hypothetical protein